MDDFGRSMEVERDCDQQPNEILTEHGQELDVNTMDHVDQPDGPSDRQDDPLPRVLAEHSLQDVESIGMKEEPTTQEKVQERVTWMEESVKIRQNVVDMLEYVSFQLQNTPPGEPVEQHEATTEGEDNHGEVEGIARLQMPTENVAFAGSEDEEILPDVGGSSSCLSFVSWAPCNTESNSGGDLGMKNEAASPSFEGELHDDSQEESNYGASQHHLIKEESLEMVQSGHEMELSEADMDSRESKMGIFKPEVVEAADTEEHVVPGTLGDNMFTSNDDNVPPCVSQEEIIADCIDGNSEETEVPLAFSGTFNNFKDAEVTVEMNEEEVDILGAGSPVVKNHDYSEDDSGDSHHNNMGYHREPLQQAMYHAMAPLPHNNEGNATLPFSSHVISNNNYNRGVKREYPNDLPNQGPVRTKAARKITPPSPVKKELVRDSPASSSSNKNLQENLRKQELDETFFTCDFCFKLFRRRNALMAHIKLHEALNIGNHNGHIYECKQCKKSYSSRYNLNHHTKRCHGDKEYKCSKCNEAYATQSDLSRHSRTHGTKSYKCNRCGKVFQKRKTFSAHTKVHPQVIYECITCFQKFSWEEELVEHNKIHQIPVGTPVTALTVKSEVSVTAPEASTDPPVPDSKAQETHANNLKLENCFSYITRVKSTFAEDPQVYQDFLNTFKQFKFKSIVMNQLLEQICILFKDYPNLIDGFNIFLPEGCKVEIPKPPKKQAVAVHDPLLDRQYNPRGELDDSLAYLGQVKARFSDKPIIYNTFTYIIKEYKLNSLQIPEVAARVTALFKDHPDLILGFNTFLPSNNRISVPCYDSQNDGSDVKLNLTESSKQPSIHGNCPDLHEGSATDTLTGQHCQRKNTLTNGHTITSPNGNTNTISVMVNGGQCAKTGTTENTHRVPVINHVNANAGAVRDFDPLEMEVDMEHGPVENLVPFSDTSLVTAEVTDRLAETEITTEENVSDKISDNTLENTPESHQHDFAPVSITTASICSPGNVSADVTSDNFSSWPMQDNISTTQGNPVISNRESKIPSPNRRNYDHVSDNKINSVTSVVPIADTFTNIITVSPTTSLNVLSNIERTVALTNPKFPKVSVISAIATGPQSKTTKYGGKGIAFTSVNVKPNVIPKLLDASKSSERSSPTKIVPLKSSLLYQQLISQSNFRGHSNSSLATFTKIDAPSVDDKKKTWAKVLNSEPNSVVGDNSSTKVNTGSNARNSSSFKTSIKISVPYIVNSPNSNVIFTLANTMVHDGSNIHGLADNPSFVTSTGIKGVESNHNGKAVYTIPGPNTPTSMANVALISTNTLQNASSTNSYTGLNIVTSTNVAPSTYTLANTKSIASFPAAAPTGNGANKQMLLIRTNPTPNAYFISSTGSHLLSSDNALRGGCLVPITKTTPSNASSSRGNNEVNANSISSEGAQTSLSNKMLALTTRKLFTQTNNRMVKPNFLAGQKIAIVKTSISDKSVGNLKTGRALTINNVIHDSVISSNVVDVTGAKQYVTNIIGSSNTSPRKRKIDPNKIVTTTGISIKKKMEPVIKNYTCRNRPLLPASGGKSHTPFVVSFLPNVVGEVTGENMPESRVPINTSVISDQSNLQVVRTYERLVASTLGNTVQENTVTEQIGGLCNNPLITPNHQSKAARKQCLIVKTTPASNESKLSGLMHNGASVCNETYPKTYSRRDSLSKQLETTGMDSPDKIPS